MMSPRQVNERLRDILDSIREVKSFVSEMSFETFKDDLRTLRAVELNFIIIGEAASAIPDSFRDNQS